MLFLAPDGSGGGGGGQGSSSAASGGGQGGGNGGGAANADLDIKLFDSLPWDELDDTTRAALEKIKGGAVATLQSKTQLQSQLQTTDKLARQFQSDADRLKAEVEKSRPKPTLEDDPYLNACREELVGAGYKKEDADALAPVFAGMFKRAGVLTGEAVSRSLAPMAGQVLASQANDAFVLAQQQDALGMFQVPEVAQGVWDMVKQRVEKGVETTPEIVLNLGKMAWADHVVAERQAGRDPNANLNGQPPVVRTALPNGGVLPATPPSMLMGGGQFTFPGAGGITPIARDVRDANAPKHELNEDTRNALASTFKTMLQGTDPSKVMPSGLKDVLTKTARGRR